MYGALLPENKIESNIKDAVKVLRHVAEWMYSSGFSHSEWWNPVNMNEEFLCKYAKPSEFYVVYISNMPAATAIIQEVQSLQDWSAVDGNKNPTALYIHYLAVERSFSGRGLSKTLLRHAELIAKDVGIPVLRLDTNADEPKLTKIYEDYGFIEQKVVSEDGHSTVLYEKHVGSVL